MTDLEARLTAELGARADALPAPTLSVPGVERAGRRERTRRRTTAVLAATVVAVIAVSVGLVAIPGGDQRAAPVAPPVPSPTQPAGVDALPLGRATDVPWWADGVLHVGGTTIDVPRIRHLVYRAGTTVADIGGGQRPSWVLVVGSHLVPLPAFVGSPVISADGTALAWSTGTSRQIGPLSHDTVRDHFSIVDYDVATRSVVDTLDSVREEPIGTGGVSIQPMVQEIESDRRVVYYVVGSRPAHVWTPGGTDLRLRGGSRGSDYSGLAPWPDGVTWRENGNQLYLGHLVPGSVHLVVSTITVPGLESTGEGTWSDDGRTYAVEAGGPRGEAAIELVASSTPGFRDVPGETSRPPSPMSVSHRLQLPGGRWTVVAWDGPHALVVASARADRLLRCDTDQLTCERVADGPTSRAVLPDPAAPF